LIVSEKDQGIYLYADGGEYNRKEEYIKIKNKPYMNLKNNQDTILITTNEIIRNIAEKNIIFKDYVKMFGKDWVLLADESIYYDDKKEFILKQNPILLGKDLYLTAEDIIYKSDEKKIQIYKKPVIFTTIKESQNKEIKNAQKDDTKNNKKNEQEKKEIMYITADLIEYNLSEKEPKGLIQGNVLMQSSTKSIYGDEFFLTGKGIEKIQTNKKVILIDKKENFYLESNFMEYDLKNKILILKNQPKIITYDDINKPEKKIRQELQASIIERDFNKEITIAKGNVFFKRDKEIAYAEYAIIDENKETLELTGSPILKRGDTEIHCKKIYVFKDKIEFERELEAKIY
jgi:lipopolysaccharide export system protein LptA